MIRFSWAQGVCGMSYKGGGKHIFRVVLFRPLYTTIQYHKVLSV